MKLCLEEAQVSQAILIADKGFHSASNVRQMDKSGLQYVMPIHRNSTVIDYTPFGTEEIQRKKQYFFYKGRVIWYNAFTKGKQKYVTFQDVDLRALEERELLMRQEEAQKTGKGITGEDLVKEMKDLGTLTLVYSLKEDKTPEEIYAIYKQRNEVEVMFDSYKNFLEGDRTYMQNRYVMDGWLLANFIAMIAYYKLHDRLREEGFLRKISPRDVLEWSKGIYQHRFGEETTWHISEIPMKRRQFFKAIGIDALT
jgi:transposase